MVDWVLKNPVMVDWALKTNILPSLEQDVANAASTRRTLGMEVEAAVQSLFIG